MKTFIQIAAVLGALAVVLGAFGAHALKPMLLETGRLETYQTAVSYHFYHTLALLLLGILYGNNSTKVLKWSAVSMVAGIIIFSGSLYALCFSGLTFLGAITPIGGVFFITGWFLLFLGIKKA